MATALPFHGICLVCGEENPHGMGLTWYAEADGSVSASFVLDEAQQGRRDTPTAVLRRRSWMRRWERRCGMPVTMWPWCI